VFNALFATVVVRMPKILLCSEQLEFRRFHAQFNGLVDIFRQSQLYLHAKIPWYLRRVARVDSFLNHCKTRVVALWRWHPAECAVSPTPDQREANTQFSSCSKG